MHRRRYSDAFCTERGGSVDPFWFIVGRVPCRPGAGLVQNGHHTDVGFD